MAEKTDALVRFLLPELRVRGVLIQAGAIIAEAGRVHGLNGSPLQLFGQTLIGAILLLSISKGGTRQVLQLDAAEHHPSPLRRILAEARAGAVRGYLNWQEGISTKPENEQADRLDGWMSTPVTLSTVRDPGFGQPYVSTITHDSPYIADQLVHYLGQSVQIDADILLYRHSGMMIEAMPGCNDERWFKAISAMADLDARRLEREAPESLLAHFNALGCKILGKDDYRYYCACNAESLKTALQAMPAERLSDIRDDNGCIQLSCQYCNRTYNIKI